MGCCAVETAAALWWMGWGCMGGGSLEIWGGKGAWAVACRGGLLRTLLFNIERVYGLVKGGGALYQLGTNFP